MSIDRVATAMQSQYMLAQINTANAALNTTQAQVASGNAASDYTGYGDKTAALEIWEIEYLQVLRGENPVAEFVKGSWLKPFLDRLDEPERGAFEADYRARVLAAYPPEADGSTLFPFRRLFILAQKS